MKAGYHACMSWWNGLPKSVRLAAIGALAVALATFAARLVTMDADFSISARTQVLTMEAPCDRRTTWTLPAGKVAPAESPDQAIEAEAIDVELRGGSRARVRIGPDSKWEMTFEAANELACAADHEKSPSTVAPDAISLSIVGRPAPASEAYVYRSTSSLGKGDDPILLLYGRILIGDEIPQGGGLLRAAATPMLAEARVEVRTPDSGTQQRRKIHEEQVDPGGVIDSYACLDQTGDASRACLQRARARQASEGFLYFAATADRDARAFDVQLSVTGERVGVRQQGGAERRIVVSRWSKIVSSPFVQILFAILAAFSFLLQAYDVMAKPTRMRGRERRG